MAKIGPAGPPLDAKIGPPGPYLSAKNGPTLPKRSAIQIVVNYTLKVCPSFFSSVGGQCVWLSIYNIIIVSLFQGATCNKGRVRNYINYKCIVHAQ